MKVKVKMLIARAVLPAGVLVLLAQAAPVRSSVPTYGLTSKVASRSNFRVAAGVFGSRSVVADWSVLKPQILSRAIGLPLLYSQTGLQPSGSAWIFKSGQGGLLGDQYFVTRFDQSPPAGFKFIDRAGSLYLSAGRPSELPVLSVRSGARTFGLTSLLPETGNLPLQVRIFGSNATLAEWDKIKAAISSRALSLSSFYQQTGLGDGASTTSDTSVWVQRGGRRYWSGNRHYLITRFDKGAPGYYLVHDSVGSLYLGSWYGMRLPALAWLSPPSVRQAASSEKLHLGENESGAVLRYPARQV